MTAQGHLDTAAIAFDMGILVIHEHLADARVGVHSEVGQAGNLQG